MRGFTNMHLDALDTLKSVIMRLFTLIACQRYRLVKGDLRQTQQASCSVLSKSCVSNPIHTQEQMDEYSPLTATQHYSQETIQ